MGIFSKLKKNTVNIIPSEIEKLISENPHMSNMSIANMTSLIKSWENGDDKIWLNPSLSSAVNSGWFTKEDFRDWAKGKGKIPKGDTQEEKNETMLYCKLHSKLPHEVFRSIDVDLDLDLDSHNEYGVELTYCDSKSKKYPGNDIIMEVTCDYINKVKEELNRVYDYSKYFVDKENSTPLDIVNSKEFKERYEKYRTEIRDELWGALSTLSKLGNGYFGACNTPERLDNFGWSRDFILGRGYLEMLKDKGLRLPNAEVINKLRFK